MKFIDKYGYPVVTVKGQWFFNFLRRLIRTDWIGKAKCLIGFHKKGYPHGLDNCGFKGYRVDFYTCQHCKKEIHWSVKVDY